LSPFPPLLSNHIPFCRREWLAHEDVDAGSKAMFEAMNRAAGSGRDMLFAQRVHELEIAERFGFNESSKLGFLPVTDARQPMKSGQCNGPTM
jgi:hypothetical protein